MLESKTCRQGRSLATPQGIYQQVTGATGRIVSDSNVFQYTYAYQAVQQPHSSPKVEYLHRIEQDGNGNANENNRVVQKDVFATNLVEVEVHDQAEEEKAPTRKLFM
jgi:hypothetical protein